MYLFEPIGGPIGPLVSDGIAALSVHTLVCRWTRGPVCRSVSVVSAGGDGPPVDFAPWSNVNAV